MIKLIIYFILFQNVGLKHTLVQAMSDWYMRSDSDHVKLSRILDIAQNLKVSELTFVFSKLLNYLLFYYFRPCRSY